MDAELAAYWVSVFQCLANGEPVLGSAGMEEAAAIAHRLAAICIFVQTQDGKLPSAVKALSRELAQLDASSPAAALVAEAGSGFEAMVAMVEQVEGARFRELFSRLPTTRAETGPQALQQVLALARGQASGVRGQAAEPS
jgi:hypothetical protein